MWYYKTEDGAPLASTDFISGYIVITEEEYNQIIKSIYEPSEEEIRAEKEEQLRQLMAELYPPEE